MDHERQKQTSKEKSGAASAKPAGLTRVGNPAGVDHLDFHVARQVLADMAGMAGKSPSPFVAGLLMGKIFTGENGRAVVMAIKLIPFQPDREGRLPRSISAKTWKKIEESRKRRVPETDIVGVFVSRQRDENHGLENDLDRSDRLINTPRRIAAFLDPATLALHIFAKSGKTIYTLSSISVLEDENAMINFSELAANGKARGKTNADGNAAVNRGRAFIAVAVLISAALCVLALELTLQLRQAGLDQRALLEKTQVQIGGLSAYNQSVAEHERLLARADDLERENQERDETIARLVSGLEENRKRLEQAEAHLQTGEEILSGHQDFFTLLNVKIEEMQSAVDKLKSTTGKNKEIMAAAALIVEQLSAVRHELQKARGQAESEDQPDRARAMAAGEAAGGALNNEPESADGNSLGNLEPTDGQTPVEP